MGVYIKGMEMPKTCHCCRMCVQVSDGDIDWHWECCLLCEKVARYAADRIPGCPLVPVPPHGDLIDRDVARESIKPWSPEDERSGCTFDTVKKLMHTMLDRAPTIIEAEEGKT